MACCRRFVPPLRIRTPPLPLRLSSAKVSLCFLSPLSSVRSVTLLSVPALPAPPVSPACLILSVSFRMASSSLRYLPATRFVLHPLSFSSTLHRLRSVSPPPFAPRLTPSPRVNSREHFCCPLLLVPFHRIPPCPLQVFSLVPAVSLLSCRLSRALTKSL